AVKTIPMSGRVFTLIGSLAASISVLAGAFGAHALADSLGDRADVYETAVRYQMYHAVALVLVGLLRSRIESGILAAAGWCFVGGIVLFSGSLYALVILDLPVLGALAPVGGLGFVAGWLLFGAGVWHARRPTTNDR
ncbi:MAG: DUF423 domain-containing protein, partial [Rhodothermales bacterium]|nr:DUF423 domain-containing protein [Rhodothermales bacterium]